MSEDEQLSRRDLLRGRMLDRLIRTEDDEPEAGPHEGAPTPVMRYPKGRDNLTPITSRARARRRTIPVLRPPGAVDEPTFLRDCTRCDRCLEACPHDAIVRAPDQFREAAGTPMIEPMRSPCRMCADFPCIAACEPGVLTQLIPPTMGTARIVEETCVAHQGGFCTVCSEQCPVPGAIEVENGRPRIAEQTCTGCGVCQYVCPAPENAVLVMPIFARPPRPAPVDSTDE